MIIFSSLVLYACSDDETSLTVEESSIEQPFNLETFDLGAIELIYTSGDETQTIPLQSDMIEDDLPSEAGEHSITVNYLEESVTFTITLEVSPLAQTLSNIYEDGVSEGLIDYDSYEEWLASIQGEDGVSIEEASINEEGMLILTFSDGTSENLGLVRAEDGVSVIDSTINDNGELTISLSNGDTINVGNVEGEDGTNVTNSEINDNGELIFTLSNGDTINAGAIVEESHLDINFRYNDGSLQWRYLDGYWRDLEPSEDDEEIYNVTFKEPFSGTIIKEKEVSENTPLVFPNVQMIGYDNEGWYADLNYNYEVEYYDYIKSDLTLYVNWERAINQGYEIREKETGEFDRVIENMGRESSKELREDGEDIAIVTGGLNHYAKHLFIPNTIDGYPVEVIDEEAFVDTNNLKELYISSNLSYIRDYAFLRSSIQTIHYTADSYLSHIGQGAFEASALEFIFIPHYVKIIGQEAFKDTHNLDEVIFEEDSYDSPGNFSGALLLKEAAFKNSAVKNIEFPTNFERFWYTNVMDGVSSSAFRAGGLYLSTETFKNTYNLEAIDLPQQTFFTKIEESNDSPNYIDELYSTSNWRIFKNSGIRNIVVPMPEYSGDYNAYIPLEIFKNTENLETVTIEDGYEKIDNRAFMNSGLSTINLPDSIEDFNNSSVFKNTYNLEEINLPDNVEAIGIQYFKNSGIQEIHISNDSNLRSVRPRAFKNSSIQSITFPVSIESIDSRSFRNTESLESVSFHGEYFENNFTLDSLAFENSGLETIIFPEVNENEENDYELLLLQRAFQNTTNLSSINLPNITQVSEIGSSGIFQGSSIESITIPESTTLITANMFRDTPNLETVHFHENVTEIYEGAFQNAESLETITLPDSINSIGARSFKDTHSLDEFTLPSEVHVISEEAFKNSNIHSFNIPENTALTEIGARAFKNTVNLSALDLPDEESLNTVDTIGSGAFQNTGIETMTIPHTVIDINDNLFKDATEIHTIELHADIESFGDNAFAGTTSLESITLPSLDDMDDFEDLFADSAISTVTLTEGSTRIPNSLFRDLTTLTEVNLPSSLEVIAPRAFKNTENLKTLNFSGTDESNHANDALRTVMFNAFNNSGIETLHFSENSSLTLIGASAFYESSIEEITLPNSLEKIDIAAFRHSEIHTVNIDEDSSLKNIELAAFADTNLESIFIPKNVQNLDSFGIGMFENTNLSEVTFADDSELERIGSKAFANTNLTEISIPESVTSFRNDVFKNTDIESIIFEGIYVDDVIADNAFNGTMSDGEFDGDFQEVDMPEMTYINIDQDAFRGLDTLETLEINRSLEDGLLDEGIFDDLVSIESVILPINLEVIHENAFANRTALQEVTLPQTLEIIESRAFQGTSIQELTLPYALEHIEQRAFNNASDLETVLYINDDGLNSIGDRAFEGTTNLETFKLLAADENALPNSLETLGDRAFKSSSLNEIIINDMLEVIGKAAFMDTPLDTVTLHEDSMLQEIHPGAFKNTNIKEFFIPSDVQTLAYSEIIPSLGSNSVYHYGVFTGSDLETVTFAEDSTLTHIGPWTFANTNLESIDFPETIESIGDFAFKNTFVESIALPAYEMKILSLSENTFSHMDQLNSIVIGADVEMLPQRIFSDLENLEIVRLPQSVQTIPQNAFLNTPSLDTLELPDALEVIERNAFVNTGLSDLDLQEHTNLHTIGRRAFTGSALESVTLPSSLEYIGDESFTNSADLESVTINDINDSALILIGDFAFANTSISEMDVPDSLERLGYGAFAETSQTTFNIHETQNLDRVMPIGIDTIDDIEDDRNPFYNTMADLTINVYSEEFYGAYVNSRWAIFEEYFDIDESLQIEE